MKRIASLDGGLQQEGAGEIEGYGIRLSEEICPVTYPGFNKKGFKCKHGFFIPAYRCSFPDWTQLKIEHDEFVRITNGRGF